MIDFTAPLDRLPDPLPIEPPNHPFDVTMNPPGSKSLTCRAYVMAALADGESIIQRPLRADDTDRLLEALCVLGAGARWVGDDVVVQGVAGTFPCGGEVNLGDGGAPTRFMIAAASLAAEPVVVDGSARMRQRPIAEGVDLLRRLGARIDYVEQEGRLPVQVSPQRPRGGELDIPTTSSSQFVSAILLVSAWLDEGVRIRFVGDVTSSGYIELTRQTLREWGVDPARPGPTSGRVYPIEPDASSAVYWMVAATITPRCSVLIPQMNSSSRQPDIAVAEPLRSAGADIDTSADGVLVKGPAGPVECFELDAGGIPDASLALAVAASQARGTSSFWGLHTLRVKETDRIAALAAELTKIGCTVRTTDDSVTIDPSTRHDRPAEIETYDDHRMAMSFAVLGLVRPGLSIRNPACVAKSYPTFWQDFAKLYQ